MGWLKGIALSSGYVAGVPERLAAGRTLSFEYYPPAGAAARRGALLTATRLARRHPDFVSVTYGAGGGDRGRTREMVAHIALGHVSGRHRCPVVPHLTCVGHTRAEIRGLLADHMEVGVGDLLALAGDPRPGEPPGDFRFAADLVEFVRTESDFSVGVAAFPEVHPDSPDRVADRQHLAAKLEMADFGITQFFFDSRDYRLMVDELSDLGCTTPVLAGVMPVTNPESVKRFANMNGTRTPKELWNRLEAADADERLRIACDQAASMIDDLVEMDVPGIHLYSLNVPEAVEGILDRLGEGYLSTTG